MVVGANFFGQIYGRIVVYWRNSDQIIQIMSRGLGGLGVGWGGGVTNAFSSNLNTVNLKIFPNHGAIFT